MPVTGLVQSALSNGYVVSDALSNDVIVRSVGENSRLLIVAGCNVDSVSCVLFAKDFARVNVPLVGCNSIRTPLIESSVVKTPSIVATSGTFQATVASNAFASFLSAPNATFSNASASNITASNVFAPLAQLSNCVVGNVRASQISGPTSNAPVAIGETGNSILFLSGPALGSTDGTVRISGDLTTSQSVRAALLLSTSNVATSTITSRISGSNAPTVPCIVLDSNDVTAVVSRTLTASNIVVSERLRLLKGVDIGDYALTPLNSNQMLGVIRVSTSNGLVMETSNAIVGLRTNSSNVSLAIGVGSSNSLSIASNGVLNLLRPLAAPSNMAVSLGDCSVTGKSGGVLSFNRAGFDQEIAALQVNAAARGGCVSFSNVDAGARVVLWQDASDINAYGGLGKEPNLVVLRSPPNQGISFVGGNGAVGTEFARFSSNGAVCINNTNAPDGRLHVKSSRDEVTAVFENTVTSSTSSLIRCARNVNLGAVIPNSLEFRVNGTVAGAVTHPTGTTTFYGTASDRRLKEEKGGVVDGLDVIDKLRPVQFVLNGDPNHTIQAGFFADEVQEVIPQAVVGKANAPDQYQLLDQTKLVPFLVSAIQTLSRRVAQLEHHHDD